MVIVLIRSTSEGSASDQHNSGGRGPGGLSVARVLEVVGGHPGALGELETRVWTIESPAQLQAGLGVIEPCVRELWEAAPRTAISME